MNLPVYTGIVFSSFRTDQNLTSILNKNQLWSCDENTTWWLSTFPANCRDNGNKSAKESLISWPVAIILWIISLSYYLDLMPFFHLWIVSLSELYFKVLRNLTFWIEQFQWRGLGACIRPLASSIYVIEMPRYKPEYSLRQPNISLS